MTAPTGWLDDRRRVLALVMLGIALRLAAVLAFPVYPLVDNTEDTAIYDEGARSLAAGQGYTWAGHPTAFFPVGWPMLLSLAYRVAGVSARSGQLLNFGLSLALVAASWGLASRLFGRRAGRLAAVAVALAPHQVIYPAFLMSEVAFTAFFTLSLMLVARGARAGWRLGLAGALMGMATLIRGPSLLFPLFVMAFAWLGERRNLRAAFLAALVFGAGMLAPLGPWAVRNHHVFGRWVVVANDGGMNFLMGNHPGATGARHEPAEGLPDTGNELQDDREGYRRGMAFIRQYPIEFLSLLPRKFVRLTAPAPLLTYRAELRSKWPGPLAFILMGLDQLLHLALWLIVGGVALRAARARSAWRREHPGLACAGDPGLRFGFLALGLWIGVHLIFLGGARYFFPMMPLTVALAASALAGRAPGDSSAA